MNPNDKPTFLTTQKIDEIMKESAASGLLEDIMSFSSIVIYPSNDDKDDNEPR